MLLAEVYFRGRALQLRILSVLVCRLEFVYELGVFVASAVILHVKLVSIIGMQLIITPRILTDVEHVSSLVLDLRILD